MKPAIIKRTKYGAWIVIYDNQHTVFAKNQVARAFMNGYNKAMQKNETQTLS